MGRKKAIRLPSSKEVFGHDNGNCEKNTLVSLLEEGLKRKLKSKDKIIITNESLRDNFNYENIPTENDLILKKEIITYGELNRIYERVFDRKYSPEEEKERSDFEIAVLERRGQARGAWGNYMSTMNYLRAVDEAREEQELIRKNDEEGLEKLRTKQNKRPHMLQIA